MSFAGTGLLSSFFFMIPNCQAPRGEIEVPRPDSPSTPPPPTLCPLLRPKPDVSEAI